LISEPGGGVVKSAEDGNTVTMSGDQDEEVVLPTAFRGYERQATDALLRRVDESYRTLLRERDQLRTRAERAEQRLADHEEEIRNVGRALLRAEEIQAKADQRLADIDAAAAQRAAEVVDQANDKAAEALQAAERQAAALREQARLQAEAIVREGEFARASAEREAHELAEHASREAESVMREAERQGGLLADDARRSIEVRAHEAEEFLTEAKERLGSLVDDLIGEARAITDLQKPAWHPHRELASESSLDRGRASD
jgi:cell division septum initiation protein DivIVA